MKHNSIRIKVIPPQMKTLLVQSLEAAIQKPLKQVSTHGRVTSLKVEKTDGDPSILLQENDLQKVKAMEISWPVDNSEAGSLAEQITQAIVGYSTNTLRFEVEPNAGESVE